MPQNELKAGPQSSLTREFRDLKGFNHSSCVDLNLFLRSDLASIENLQPPPAHDSWCGSALIFHLPDSNFLSCWKPFISFPTTLLGTVEFVGRKSKFFFSFYSSCKCKQAINTTRTFFFLQILLTLRFIQWL